MKAPLTPHITEKSYRTIPESSDGFSVYTFKVAAGISKDMVKKLVEREHKVSVVSVNMTILPGKARRFKGVSGRTSAVRKALVRLKAGDRIAAFDISKKDSEDKN